MMHGLDWSSSSYEQVSRACECGNEPTDSMQCGKFIDKLRNY
jgi:hypothetical protein